MSRLDSAIRRLTAQKIALAWAKNQVLGRPGPVLELGLGNGRTYDHLREILGATREIFVFEREIRAHPDCVPDDDHLFLGDFTDTLPRALACLGSTALIAHLDIGTGDKRRSTNLANRIRADVEALLGPGAVAVSDQKVGSWENRRAVLPDGIPEGRIHLYQFTG
ncbi:MAG: hypothetical protein CMM47_08000 [Rhodospirillaceae bacterium]|nr:hypothetical protein [Rhodospirillaceae bacterium]